MVDILHNRCKVDKCFVSYSSETSSDIESRDFTDDVTTLSKIKNVHGNIQCIICVYLHVKLKVLISYFFYRHDKSYVESQSATLQRRVNNLLRAQRDDLNGQEEQDSIALVQQMRIMMVAIQNRIMDIRRTVDQNTQALADNGEAQIYLRNEDLLSRIYGGDYIILHRSSY